MTAGQVLADLKAEQLFRSQHGRASTGSVERDLWLRLMLEKAQANQFPEPPSSPPEQKVRRKRRKVPVGVNREIADMLGIIQKWGRRELMNSHPERHGNTPESNAIANAIREAVERLNAALAPVKA